MTKYVVVLAIMDMASAKSDVNDPKKKIIFLTTLSWKVTEKNKINVSKMLRSSLY